MEVFNNDVIARDPKGAIRQALADPSAIHILPLVRVPAINNFLNEEPETRRILEIFSFGTISDWPENVSLEPKLVNKLRQLSLITYATTEKELSYTTLMNNLKLNSIRELEDIVIEAVYNDLIKARLDSKRQIVQIIDWTPRDIQADKLVDMTAILSDWLTNAEKVQKKSAQFCVDEFERLEEKNKEKAVADKLVADATAVIEQQFRRDNYERSSGVTGTPGTSSSSMSNAPIPGPSRVRGNRTSRNHPTIDKEF